MTLAQFLAIKFAEHDRNFGMEAEYNIPDLTAHITNWIKEYEEQNK